MVFGWQVDEPCEGMLFSKPVLANTWDVFIGRHECTAIGCRVFEEDVVVGPFGEEVYRPLDIPLSADHCIDDLLTHASVEEDRKATGH